MLVNLICGMSFLLCLIVAGEPLMKAFVHGYGVVAASVVGVEPAGNGRFDVRCKVEQIVGQPVVGDVLPLRQDQEFHVLIATGYAEVIEEFVTIRPADKYILTLRYDPRKNTFDTARTVLGDVADPKLPRQERDVRGLDQLLTALDPDFKPASRVRIDGWLKLIFAPL